MKKILMVCPSLDAGGAEKASIAISNYLIETNEFEISFLIFSENSYLKNTLNKNIKLFSPANSNRSYSKSLTIRSVQMLNHILKLNSFDMLISTNEIVSELPIIFAKRRISSEIKLISIIQNSTKNLYQDYNLKNKLLCTFVERFRKGIFNTVITVNSSLCAELKNVSKLKVIPNPLTIRNEHKENLTSQKHIPQNEKYFISISRITKQKNLDLLINAYKLIENKTKNKLLIIGSTTDEAEYSRLVKLIDDLKLNSKIALMLPDQNHLTLLSNAEAFLFTSKYEGFPLSLLESMYSRVPIISTKFFGYKDILNEDNSILVDGYSAQKFSSAIINFEQNKLNIAKMINNAHNFSLKFDISIIGDLYYNTLLSD